MKKRKLLLLLYIGMLCLPGCSGKSDNNSNNLETGNEVSRNADNGGTTNVTDDETIEEDEEIATDMEEAGEAVFESITDVNLLLEAKTTKEQNYSQTKESLLELINSENITDEEKQSAINKMVQMTDIAEKELAAETLLISQGFEEALVVINVSYNDPDNVYDYDCYADVLVAAAELNDAQRAEIKNIIKRKTGLEAENIAITCLSTSESE